MSVWCRWSGYGGVQPSDRTKIFLRNYALEEAYASDPESVLAELQQSTDDHPDLERLQVLSELAYIEGHQHRLAGRELEAGQFLSTAAMASYQYLFDPRLDVQRNAYDPRFRQVCDTYNASLEGMLRIMREQGALRPGGFFTATAIDGQPLTVGVSMSGRWSEHNFERFEFVTDFDTTGLKNVYHTYGLGVPLIGIREGGVEQVSYVEQYYPDNLSVPMTAFAQASMTAENSAAGQPRKLLIQLVDPMEQADVDIGNRAAPLESDLTTPIAYYLNDPLLGTSVLATASLLDAEFAGQYRGMYMLEPFDPDKIPVVMVHGLWSSPITWTEMFNDLRADPKIRDNYQFWFYSYPSGQPFWFSARQMREDLRQLAADLNPEHAAPALEQMVLVGHSMGGLVSRLQTLDSDDRFWHLISDQPFEKLEADDEARALIGDTLFFDHNPDIARVITIGTPHRGSNFANSVTRWFSHQFFRMPAALVNEFSTVISENREILREECLLKIPTSIDSLAPDSPFFDAMQGATRSPVVTYHNIIGVTEPSSWRIGPPPEPSDGVVTVASAKAPDATTQIEVPAEHSTIHRHPLAIREVHRILLEHLAEQE